MTYHRFPIQRLPDELCLEVLKTLNYYEMIAYSFVSKKAHSMIKSLRVETLSTSVELKKSLEIRWTTRDYGSTSFNLKSLQNDGDSDSDEEPETEEIPQTNKTEEEEINTIKDLPGRVEHIGIVNLKELYIQSGQNLNFDDLLTLNVEILKIDDANQISLRDLNRFFKLWMKGSFPNLKEFLITKRTGVFPDWNILLKGLRAEEPDAFKIVHTRKAPQVQVVGPEEEPEEEPKEDSEDEIEESEDVQEEEEKDKSDAQEEEESDKMEESEEVIEESEAEPEEESEGAQEVDEVEEEPEEDKMEESHEDEQEEDEEARGEESEPESDSEDEQEELEDEEEEEDEVEWVEQPEEEPPGPTSMNVKIRNCHGVCADIQLQYISGMICYVRFFIRDPNETYAIWY
ncbi:hypothetical protein B9Z55_011100 [Caenorhabditis nigoni]|uniref:F-box domain-containing protein n=1 Tax=Caenorhabditis nigoni TaxID=1611254 RepID=A0A2G5UIR6_9PELO|nr:hypothetical protein B9Z55_011100 [Caenorhabditis nigoni]